METLSEIEDNITPSNFYIWYFLVYILEAVNQSEGIGTPKFDSISHVGIYLDCSPYYGDTVALVLNMTLGLVSPQYHVVFDNKLSTMSYLKLSMLPPN